MWVKLKHMKTALLPEPLGSFIEPLSASFGMKNKCPLAESCAQASQGDELYLYRE